VVVIPSGARNKQASANLLAWMVSPEVVAEEFCLNANLPTSKKAASDPCFTSNPKFKVFIDLMSGSNATASITSPISLELNNALSLAEEQILHAGANPLPLLNQIQTQYAPRLPAAVKSSRDRK
jgi:ABC-type glycerol-3-phosphate transport system substrate-binding protein